VKKGQADLQLKGLSPIVGYHHEGDLPLQVIAQASGHGFLDGQEWSKGRAHVPREGRDGVTRLEKRFHS
jgi:hypothetical protein